MPIKFRCKRCNQLLGIASRKAGSETKCPKCGIALVVPSEEAALAAMAMTQSAKVQEEPESPSQVVVYDDEPAAIEAPRQRVRQAATPAAPTRETSAARSSQFESGQPVPRGMILYPRRTFYVQGLLFLILAGIAFGSGYLIGRGDARYEKQREEEAKERLLVEGNLIYNPAAGQIAGDDGAVVIALPEGEFPESKLSIRGIGPHDPLPKDSNRSLKAIRRLGGAYVRANESGNFSLVVPKQGRYRLLIVSRHATRPQGDKPDEADLAEMEEYFRRADDLIGRQKYRWTSEDVKIGFNPIELDFGQDGQP